MVVQNRLLDYRLSNPLRPPDWRWRKAAYLLDNESVQLTLSADRMTRKAVKWHRQLNAADETLIVVFADKETDFYNAYMVYIAVAGPNRTLAIGHYKWELEARLLANEPFEAIALKTGLTVKTIELYEKLFFSVLSRLDSPSAITHAVLGKSIHSGLNQRSYDCLWKLFGYHAGAKVLDYLIYTIASKTRPETEMNAVNYFADDFKDTIRVKAALALRMMPVETETYETIFRTYLQALSLEQHIDMAGGDSDSIKHNITALLETITMSQHSKITPQTSEQKILGHTQCHLRTTELLQLAGGEDISVVTEQTQSMTFPKATHANDN